MTAEEQVEGPSLARRVGHGALWSAGSNVVMRFASVAITALLARVLSQEDFGVFAIALAVYAIVASLAELGMGSAVARSALEPDDIAPTVTSISVLTSLVLAAAMALGAEPLASLLGQPEAAEPIRVLALCLVLTGIFAVPGAQLVREFRQDRIFLATVVGFLVGNPVLLVLALQGGGATAFAWSRVVGQLAVGAVMVASLSRRYRPGWNAAVVGSLVRFGLPLSLANLVNWTLLNADYLVIGRMVSAAEVGVYMIAFNVANWSTSILGSVLNNVVVPALGRVSGSREELGRATTSATRLVALVAMPVAALTVGLAGPLVETVFGARWSQAAGVLQVLGVYGGMYAFSLLFVNVLVAAGATGRLLAVQVLWAAALAPGMVVGVRLFGLTGAAWAHVAVMALLALPCYGLMVRRVTGRSAAALARATSRPAVAAAVGGLVAWGAATVLGGGAAGLLAGGLAGTAAYLAVAAPLIAALLPDSARARVRAAVPLAGSRAG